MAPGLASLRAPISQVCRHPRFSTPAQRTLRFESTASTTATTAADDPAPAKSAESEPKLANPAAPSDNTERELQSRESRAQKDVVNESRGEPKPIAKKKTAKGPRRNSGDGPPRKPNSAPGTTRNEFKHIYKVEAAGVNDANTWKLHRPVTGRPKTYPSQSATGTSFATYKKDIRRQVAQGIILDKLNMKKPQWWDCFHLMKNMTPVWDKRAPMSAVRVVFPADLDLEVNNQRVQYVDLTTGVLRKIRTAVDKNPRSIILRGSEAVLTKAANEIVKQYPASKIYELGDVETFDFQTKQLWPVIDEAGNDKGPSSQDSEPSFWVHKEHETTWLSTRYEDIPRPERWTQETFDDYITTLLHSRIPANLVLSLYGRKGEADGRYIDTEGIRAGLIVDAFTDPEAQSFVTSPILKQAVSLLAFKGGHRSSADRLIQLGETYGIPMDAGVYNLLLEGYVANRNFGFFQQLLKRMKARYIHPNIHTWLLFLKLTRSEDERRHIILTMYELGKFNNETLYRGISDVTIEQDAYEAFKIGRKLDDFIKDRDRSYGKEWFTATSAEHIIKELLRFDDTEGESRIDDCKKIIGMQIEAGHHLPLGAIHVFLNHAAYISDWTLCFWALSLLETRGLQPNRDTYYHLTRLAITWKAPHTLAAIMFCGVVQRALHTPTRKRLRSILTATHRDPVWQRWNRQPRFLPRVAAADLEKTKIPSPKSIMSGVERAILNRWDQYTLNQPLTDVLRRGRKNDNDLRKLILDKGEDADVDEVHPVGVELKRADGKLTQIWLNTRFNPALMVEGWTRQSTVPEGTEHVPARTESSLTRDDLDIQDALSVTEVADLDGNRAS